MSEQNKIPCAVAQDLMPLVIDGAASEQSRQAAKRRSRARRAGQGGAGLPPGCQAPAQAFSCLENRRAVPGAGGGHLPGHGRRQARAFAGLCAGCAPLLGAGFAAGAHNTGRAAAAVYPRAAVQAALWLEILNQ